MPLKINVEVIPHDRQRYPTVGDWWWDARGVLQLRVSDMGDWRYEVLVAVHELAECFMCRHIGITQDEVDDFDKAFEARRQEGNTDEPGDDPRAPYRREHCIATGIERILAAFLGVNWNDYDEAINSL